MAMRRRARETTGFTLMEVLIAIAILAVGLVAVFTLFPVGIYAVKETVESTRAASIARTARSDMTAMRADLDVQNNASRYYGGYVPFGTWERPAHLWVNRGFLYQYIDNEATPVLHNRVLFDDRRMVSVRMRGDFDGSARVVVDRSILTRDSDILELYYNATAGANKYAPWEIRLRVKGREYQIINRNYAGTDLDWLDVLDPAATMPGAAGAETLPFEILLAVALKEPPLEVPLEWTGGTADFDGGLGPLTIYGATETRNAAMYLFGNSTAGLGGWVSVDGDWFQVDSVGLNADDMPDSMTLEGGDPPPASAEARKFELVLPVGFFDGSNFPAPGIQRILVAAGGALNRSAGGGPQLGFLESGAWIEVVLDGGRGTFVPVKPVPPLDPLITRVTVMDVDGLNPDTEDFIRPGNFIRVAGKDYEIDSVRTNPDGDGDEEFDLVGTVPAFGVDRQFKIVLGYIQGANQIPGVARFPVRRVTRTPSIAPPYSYPVTSFDVGVDINGNLPADLWPAGAPDPMDNPVRVLPANRDRYSYQVVMLPKSLLARFESGTAEASAPDPAESAGVANIPPIPYPSILDSNVMAANNNVFQIRALTDTGASFSRDLADTITVGGVANAKLQMAIGGSPLFDSIGDIPIHLFDRNDFFSDPPGTDILVGHGTMIDTGTREVTFNVVFENVIFLAGSAAPLPRVRVRLSGMAASTEVTDVDPSLSSFTVLDATGLANGAAVDIYVIDTGAQRNRPYGRGNFVEGSDVVIAIYPDEIAGFPGIPGRGLPYSTTMPQRYHLAVGDYIRRRRLADGVQDDTWYAVKAIHDDSDPAKRDFLILDRPYEGADTADFALGDYFEYVTPIREAYTAQVVVFRNYRSSALRDGAGTRDGAAAFGFNATSAPDSLRVHLTAPLPSNVKAGDHIRADGDADHPNNDTGLHGGTIDGDRRWYMIQSIGPAGALPGDLNFRTELTLVSPYRGYMPAGEMFQPASTSPSVVRTFDTVLGAF